MATVSKDIDPFSAVISYDAYPLERVPTLVVRMGNCVQTQSCALADLTSTITRIILVMFSIPPTDPLPVLNAGALVWTFDTDDEAVMFRLKYL